MRKAKYIFWLLLCLSSTFSLKGQPRLDSLYALASGQSIGCILVPQGDSFILIGHGTNDNPYNSLGTLFTEFDREGNIKTSSFTLDSNRYRLYYNMNAVVLDTFLYTTFGGTSPFQLLKFNIHNGRIEKRISLENQLVDNGYFDSYSLALIDSQNVLINCLIYNKNQKLMTQLSIYNIEYDTFSYHFNQHLSYDQIITDVVKSEEGYILSGYLRLGNPNDSEYISKALVIWLNEDFVEKRRYVSDGDSLEGLGFDMVLNDNKSIIATNCVGHHIDPFSSNHFVIPVWRPSIYSVDSVGNLLWQTEMGYSHFGEVHCIFNALVPSNSRDGFIAVGAQTNFSALEYYLGDDTLNEKGEVFRFDALIAKVSNSGDSLWSRHLYTSNFLYSNAILIDIIPDPEGGYILTGWANKHPYTPDKPAVYTWLISIDEFGCIVPGCHEIVKTEDVSLPNKMLLHPNPTSDVLFIYQQEGESMHYRVLNSKGEIIEEFQIKNAESTFMLNVSNYGPGVYYLVKINEHSSYRTEKWIKI
jgi:type IX secretion system substrate protein